MARDELLYSRLTESIIGSFYEVYNHLGYGFLESVYQKALLIELTLRGHHVQREVLVNVYYKGYHVGHHRVDLIVEHRVVVETKASEQLPKIAVPQCVSYLRACRLLVGLLLHFGPEPRVKRVRCPADSLPEPNELTE
jgi:GxxExxY protein